MTQVLVAYGSRRGGTAEIAVWIGAELRKAGLRADVRPARAVRDLAAYHAVVLGGALYGGRWHRDARRFARLHGGALRERPVWLFSSGPLDRSAETAEIPPVRGVRRIAGRIAAQGHATFGGRLIEDARGFIAARMAVRLAGDYRDRRQVQEWARGVAAELRRPVHPVPTPPAPGDRAAPGARMAPGHAGGHGPERAPSRNSGGGRGRR